jgi:SSS family solute:Na+ symporter
MLYMGFEQDMGQKYFAAKSPKIITFSAIFAAILVLTTSAVAVYFGVALRTTGISIGANQDAFISAVTLFTNPIITSFIACGTIMVIFSTTSSLLSAITSNLAFDLPYLTKGNEKKQLLASRTITLLVGLAGILASFTFSSILSLLLQAYEFSVCTICPAIVMAIFAKNPNKKAAILSMIIGMSSFLFLPKELLFIPKELISLTLSFGGYFLGKKMFYKKEEKIAA